MKLNRKVIGIDNGVFLCSDGTMWERVERTTTSCNSGAWGGTITTSDTQWVQLENVPQIETVEDVEPKITITVCHSNMKRIRG